MPSVVIGENNLFISDEYTGTGDEMSCPHNLASVPAKVLVCLVGGPKKYDAPSIVIGKHTKDVVKCTVTQGWKFRVVAC